MDTSARSPLGPAVRLSIDFVRAHLRTLSSVDGCLPPVRQLARDAGVGVVTMVRAIRWLAGAGELAVRHGSGIRAVSGGAQPPDQTARLARHHERPWESVRGRIAADILGGTYRAGEALPSVKTMCVHYGTTYHSARRALDSLVSARLVAPHGRGFIAAQPDTARSPLPVTLLGLADQNGSLMDRTPWTADLVRSIERETAALRIPLRVAPFVPHAGGLRFFDVERGRWSTDERVVVPSLGYIVWAESPAWETVSLVRRLLERRAPVAVLCEGRTIPLPADLLQRRNLNVFRMAVDAQAGSAVARHLLCDGHRDIAFVSLLHCHEWSRNRLAGIWSACDAAGARLSTYVSNGYRYLSDFDAAVRPELAEQVLAGTDESFASSVRRRAAMHLQVALRRQVFGAVAEPLFRRAAADSRHTAWVCGNDELAVAALEYARARGLRRPQPAICGFDDSAEALREGITSYNFGAPTVVHAMLQFVVRNEPAARRLVGAQYEGYIASRRSTERTRIAIRGPGPAGVASASHTEHVGKLSGRAAR